MNPMKTLTINGVTYHVTPVVPTSSVTLLASEWAGDGEAYSQVVALPGVTLNTKVDLQPTPEQLEEFHYLTLAFVAENEGGVVTVYAIGDKPTNDHTIQVTLTEVEGAARIRGNTVGTTMPRPDWNQEDPTKADYIKNKPVLDTTLSVPGSPADAAAVGASKAPAGYGLGEWFTRAADHADADYIEETGWFNAEANTPDNTRWVIHAIADAPSCEIQIAYKNGLVARRTMDDSWSWTPWEYENPPMLLDTEYRTTERYMGQAVYTKLIHVSSLPPSGGSFSVDLGVSVTRVFHVSGVMEFEGGIVEPLHLYSTPGGNAQVTWYWSGVKLYFDSTTDLSLYDAYITVKYIKE